MDKINLGIVGAAGRGSSFKLAVDLIKTVRVHAVCDVDVEGLDRAAKYLGASEKYVDYEEMLARSAIDAVIIATPMHLHVPQSILALQRDVHVFSEVTAGVSASEAGSWCRVVEGNEAEVEATGFNEKEVLELLEGSFWVKPAPNLSQCMRSRPGPTTTSSFCARCFCIRLQHRLKMML